MCIARRWNIFDCFVIPKWSFTLKNQSTRKLEEYYVTMQRWSWPVDKYCVSVSSIPWEIIWKTNKLVTVTADYWSLCLLLLAKCKNIKYVGKHTRIVGNIDRYYTFLPMLIEKLRSWDDNSIPKDPFPLTYELVGYLFLNFKIFSIKGFSKSL